VILLLIGFVLPNPAGSAALKTRYSLRMDAAEQKVWTNDDIPLLRETAPIFSASASSQASAAETSSAAANALTQPYVKELDPRWYAQQRDTLQTGTDADQEQIREIQQIASKPATGFQTRFRSIKTRQD
jgi:hypothetical protein